MRPNRMIFSSYGSSIHPQTLVSDPTMPQFWLKKRTTGEDSFRILRVILPIILRWLKISLSRGVSTILIIWLAITLFMLIVLQGNKSSRTEFGQQMANCTCLWNVFEMAYYLIPDAILFKFGPYLRNSTHVWPTNGPTDRLTDWPTDGHSLL